MKTAEEILREKQVEYNNSINKSENNMTDEEWKETLADPVFQSLIKAMKSYAQQECEKVRQDIANQSVEMIYDRTDEDEKIQFKGLILRYFQVCYAVSKQSILSTPIELT